MKILNYNNWKLWTQTLLDWLENQFAAVASSIDFTTVNNKIDTVGGKVDAVSGKIGTPASGQAADLFAALRNINIDTTDLAKQGTNADATLTAVLEALTGGDEPSPDIPEGVAERLAAIMRFFNITEATEYTALTPAEAIAIARDCQYNVMGTDWPIPTWLPTGVTEAQVESAAEGLGIPYHEPTQTA